MPQNFWIGTTSNYGTAGNWSLAAVPVAGDDVIFDGSRSVFDVDTTLDQSAVDLASFTVLDNYTGKIGTNIAPLQIRSAVVNLGKRTNQSTFGSGSSRIYINTGSAEAATITVESTATTSADTGKPPVRIAGTNASTIVRVKKGKVGIGVVEGEAVTVATLEVGFVNNRESDAEVIVNSGVTLTTVNKLGGKLLLRCAATTLTNEAGELETAGSGAYTTINMNGGTLISNSTGTITTLNGNAGHADFLRSSVARTVTTTNIRGGFQMSYDPSVITLTNKPAAAEAILLQAIAA